MLIERIDNWRTRIISQGVDSAQSQGKLPEAIAKAERFGKWNMALGRWEMLFYIVLVVTTNPIAATSILLPTAVTHLLLEGFNERRIEHLNKALDEQLGESSGLILPPLGNQTTI